MPLTLPTSPNSYSRSAEQERSRKLEAADKENWKRNQNIQIAGGATLSFQATDGSNWSFGVNGDGSVYMKNVATGVVVPIGGGSGNPPELETDGVANPVQSLLNLIGGSNVTLTADAAGGVTIDAAAGQGLVQSVFGRQGAVIAYKGDYTAAQVTNAVDSTQSYADPAWITSLAWSKITGVPAAGVSSVFGRTGAVVAAAGDYTAGEVTNAVDSTQTYANPSWITSLDWSKITNPPSVSAYQTPWLSDIDGGGYALSDVDQISVGGLAGQRGVPLIAGSYQGTCIQLNPGSGETNLEIYFQGNVRWSAGVGLDSASYGAGLFYLIQEGGNIALCIDANNHVGIGTTSPQYPLDVTGDLNITGVYRINGVPISTGGAVSSVFGRTGAVVAASGDYTAAEVTNAVDQSQTYANPAWITSLAWSKITGTPAAYVLPAATATLLGGVKIGSGITVQTDGTISVTAAGSGTVTSVALTMPSDFTVGGSPITTSGTLAVTRATQAKNVVLAGPASGSNAAPTYRALVAADLPSGTGSGTVTSAALTMPAEFSVAGSPITTSGTFAVTKATQSANLVYAGPASGSAAAPAFRALVAADMPSGLGTGTVTSVALAMPAEFTVSGSPVTSSGTLSVSKATQAANLVYAGPASGSAAAPTFRVLAAADIPAAAIAGFQTPWLSNINAAQYSLQNAASIEADTSFLFNTWYDGTNWRARNNAAALMFYANSEATGISAAQSVAAGAVQTFAEQIRFADNTTPVPEIILWNNLRTVGNVAAALSDTSYFTQLWSQNAIIFSANGDLRFGTATDLNATGFSEKVRMAASGNVGIGTSGPQVPLDVIGVIRAGNTNVWPTSGEGVEIGYYPSSWGICQAYNRTAGAFDPMHVDGNPLSLNSASNAIVFINSNTGAEPPGTAMAGGLVVNSQVANGTAFVVQSQGNNNFALNVLSNGSWQMYDYALGNWANSITSQKGYVGINNTNPQTALDVIGNIAVSLKSYVLFNGPTDTNHSIFDTGSNQMQFNEWTGTFFFYNPQNGGYMMTTDGANFNVYGQIHSRNGGSSGGNNACVTYDDRTDGSQWVNYGYGGLWRIYNTTTGADALWINKSGWIGIGTAGNISEPLTISGLGNSGQIRMIDGNYGALFRNDGGTLWLLSTNSGDQYGAWNGYRPFSFNMGNGNVGLGGGAGADVPVCIQAVTQSATAGDGYLNTGQYYISNPNTSYIYFRVRCSDGVVRGAYLSIS